MASRFLRLGTTALRSGPNFAAPTALAPVPAGADDAQGFSNLNANAASDPIPVGKFGTALVTLYSDTTCVASLQVFGAATQAGPWVAIGSAAANPSLAAPVVVDAFANGRFNFIKVTTSGYASGNPRATVDARASRGVANAASVGFNASTNSGATAGGSFSFNHTCAGPKAYLVVIVGSYGGAAGIPSGVTYNGVAMTSLGTYTATNAVSVWGLVAPATGSSLAVAVTGAGLPGNSIGSAYSFTNVNQASPVGAAVFNSAYDASPNVTVPSGVGQTIAAAANDFSGTAFTTPSGASQFALGAYAGQTQSGSNPNISWALGGADTWSIGAVSVKP